MTTSSTHFPLCDTSVGERDTSPVSRTSVLHFISLVPSGFVLSLQGDSSVGPRSCLHVATDVRPYNSMKGSTGITRGTDHAHIRDKTRDVRP